MIKMAFFENINKIWSEKTPHQKWRAFYDFGKFMADAIQIGIFGDLHVGWLGWIPAVNCFGYFSMLIFTVYYHIDRQQSQECLLCFCFFGVATAVSSLKIYKTK